MSGGSRRSYTVLAGRVSAPLLAVALLAAGIAGKSGVQVLDRATTARLALLHLHGVPGEAEYVHTFGRPAPFVDPHCHAPVGAEVQQISADDLLAASALASAATCATSDPLPVVAPGLASGGPAPALPPAALSSRPLVPPPQV